MLMAEDVKPAKVKADPTIKDKDGRLAAWFGDQWHYGAKTELSALLEKAEQEWEAVSASFVQNIGIYKCIAAKAPFPLGRIQSSVFTHTPGLQCRGNRRVHRDFPPPWLTAPLDNMIRLPGFPL